MKKQLLMAGIAACFLLTGYAQTNQASTAATPKGPICGSKAPSAEWENDFQKQVSQYKSEHASQRGTQAIITIPVIVHVIFDGHRPVGTDDNLAYAQIQAQIDVFNEAMEGITPGNSSAPIVFKAVDAGDMPIRFCLATKDPNGNALAEPGVERIDFRNMSISSQIDTANLSVASINKLKPSTIWDPSKYMNVWTFDFFPPSTAGLYGWATFPKSSTLSGIVNDETLETDSTSGLMIGTRAFGCKDKYPNGYYALGYNLGIAVVHEVGHYLGCRHVNGDASCGDDFCNDTPPMVGGHGGNTSNLNWGCPTYPWQPNGCGPGSSPFGEMFMNYMDYSDDNCRVMFTQDQRTRIETAMANAPLRKYLGTHGVCDAITGITETTTGLQNIAVYPNPSTGVFVVSGKLSTNGKCVLQIHNTLSQLVYSKNINDNTMSEKQIDLSHLPEGIYLLQLSSDLGKFTQRIVIQ